MRGDEKEEARGEGPGPLNSDFFGYATVCLYNLP